MSWQSSWFFLRGIKILSRNRTITWLLLGAGPAGLIASISAAGLGARVALIESRFMGGDCLNRRLRALQSTAGVDQVQDLLV